MRGVANRVLIALVGLVVVAAGGWLGVTWLVGHGRMETDLPSWWPGLGAHEQIADRAAVDRIREHGWWTPVVISGLAVGLVFFLGWLFMQAGARGPAALALRRSGARLRRTTLERALGIEVEALPGVAGARARLSMKRKRRRGMYHPGWFRARMTIVLEPYAEPGPVLEELMRGPLADIGSSTGFGIPRTAVRMRAASHRGRKVR